ncbi:MAG: RNA polymerase sigma factor [Planctomycetaceae bacterium]
MSYSESPQRLSQIQTLWTVVGRAHGDGPAKDVNSAQHQLLERYGKVVHRYLLGALRDADAADELSQEFALKFVRGDLGGADPSRGRFRDFLKGVLFHLIGDYHRRRKKQALPLPGEHDPADSMQDLELDESFLKSWREELLKRAWNALQAAEQENGPPFHTVLQYRAAHPEMRSEEMASGISELLNKDLSASWVRQNLHRAREKFADALLSEVLQTLREPTVGALEQELIDVGLIDYCRPALDQLRDR